MINNKIYLIRDRIIIDIVIYTLLLLIVLNFNIFFKNYILYTYILYNQTLNMELFLIAFSLVWKITILYLHLTRYLFLLELQEYAKLRIVDCSDGFPKFIRRIIIDKKDYKDAQKACVFAEEWYFYRPPEADAFARSVFVPKTKKDRTLQNIYHKKKYKFFLVTRKKHYVFNPVLFYNERLGKCILSRKELQVIDINYMETLNFALQNSDITSCRDFDLSLSRVSIPGSTSNQSSIAEMNDQWSFVMRGFLVYQNYYPVTISNDSVDMHKDRGSELAPITW